MIGRR
jgi:hypothetical protein